MGQEGSKEVSEEDKVEREDGVDEEGAASREEDLNQVRLALLSVSNASKRKHHQQQGSQLAFLLAKTEEELKEERPLSVGAFPQELFNALNDSFASSNTLLVFQASLLAIALFPSGTNSAFGFSKEHSKKISALNNQFSLTNREKASRLADVSEEQQWWFEYWRKSAPFEGMGQCFNEFVTNTLSYLLLDKNVKVSRVATALLAVLFLHMKNRLISLEPKGLLLQCTDKDPLTQYFAVVALGNLCLSTSPKLGQVTSFASSVNYMMHAGMLELLNIVCNPLVPTFLLEAALRALLILSGDVQQRARMAHVKVFVFRLLEFQRGVESGHDLRNGYLPQRPVVVSTYGVSDEYEARDRETLCCPALHVLFFLLRLPHDHSEVQAFRHLTRASLQSDLVYELACMLMCELSGEAENLWLFRMPFRMYTPEYVDNWEPTIRDEDPTSPGSQSSNPELKGFKAYRKSPQSPLSKAKTASTSTRSIQGTLRRSVLSESDRDRRILSLSQRRLRANETAVSMRLSDVQSGTSHEVSGFVLVPEEEQVQEEKRRQLLESEDDHGRMREDDSSADSKESEDGEKERYEEGEGAEAELVWFEVLFYRYSSRQLSISSRVALATTVMNLCVSREVLQDFDKQFSLSDVVDAFTGLFTRDPSHSFDRLWKEFTTSPELMHSGSQFPRWSILQALFMDTGIDANGILSSSAFQQTKPPSDPAFAEIMHNFYQANCCEILEKHVSQAISHPPGMCPVPQSYIRLLALLLESTSSAQTLNQLLRIVCVLAMESSANAELLFDAGIVKTLTRILWIVVERVGLLMVDIHVDDDACHSTLFYKDTEQTNQLRSERKSGLSRPRKGLQRAQESFLESDPDISQHSTVLMASGKIVVASAFLNRVRAMVTEEGPPLFLQTVQTLVAFAVHDSLRTMLAVQYRLRFLFFKLLQLFKHLAVAEDGSVVAATRETDRVISSVEITSTLFDKQVEVRVYEELIVGVGNLAPRNDHMSKTSWALDENATLLKNLVALLHPRYTPRLSAELFYEGRPGLRVEHLISFKSLCALENISHSRGAKMVLIMSTTFLSSLGSLLEKIPGHESWLGSRKRSTAVSVLNNLTLAPEGMKVWLKLENKQRMCVDSSGLWMPVYGKALRRQAFAGLGLRQTRSEDYNEQFQAYLSLCSSSNRSDRIAFLNAGSFAFFEQQKRDVHLQASALQVPVAKSCWGCNFVEDDVIVLHENGIALGGEWTIGVWIYVDFDAIEEACAYKSQPLQKSFVLAQSLSGDCIVSVLRRELVSRDTSKHDYVFELGCFDATSRTWFGTGIDLYKLVPGWHHLAVVGNGGKTLFYVDGGASVPVSTVDFQCTSNVYVVGNSVHLDEPWGTAADFRLYPFAVSRDPRDWDMFFDGRTWGVSSYPDPEDFPIVKPSQQQDKLEGGLFFVKPWKQLHEAPWFYRPPDFLRCVVAEHEDGALLHVLMDEFHRVDGSLGQTIATQVLANLSLCSFLRNKMLAWDAHGYFMKHLARKLGSKDRPFDQSKATDFALHRLIYFLS